jgi:hypothetical protein
VKRPSVVTVMVFVFLLLAHTASAQTSSIAGVVRDTTGAVVPGVIVEAASPALIEKVRTAVTDDQGQYKIVGLRPGVYSVAFTLTGFSTVRREGIELTANFAGTVNAEMRIGSIEESVTVSGQSPTVDVHNVVQQNVISRDVFDAIPSGKTIPAYASMTVGVSIPPTAQDVGGSKGEVSIRMTIHGSREGDQRLHQDGMRTNSAEGAGRGFFANPANAQEITLDLGGGSAESELGGIQMNVVPKEGGNRYSGFFLTNFTNHNLQSGNLTPGLEARGLTKVNGVDKIWDANAAFGGPIKQDALWFFTAHRSWGNSSRVAGVFENKTPQSWFYTPDLEKQAIVDYRNRAHSLRLTWQASRRNKFNLSYDLQDNCDCHRDLGDGTRSPEATAIFSYSPNYLVQGSWSFPLSNKLLFEAGGTGLLFDWPNLRQPGVTPDTISVQEQSTGFRYRAAASGYGNKYSSQINYKYSTSYITGSHVFKTGLFVQHGWRRHVNEVNGDMSYRFNNGVPNRVTLWATPIVLNENLKANVGVFAQDQWTIDRLTLNLGLRFDYLNAYVPEQHLGAGRFVPARDFAEVPCVPCWKDLSPRLAASYDLFGTGKTALKVSVGKYMAAEFVGTARNNNPVQTSVSNANRNWTDANGDFVPQENELGGLSNANFGKVNITTRYDDEVLKGFGGREHNWQYSTSIQHELATGVGVSVGYFRTAWKNLTTTDNLATTQADYDEYSLRAPADPRLPGSGGELITGLYDVSRAKFGQVDNLVQHASRFGGRTDIYNGVDFNFSVRARQGVFVQGGFSTGRQATNACVALDSQQDLRFCEVTPPFQTQMKLLGGYTFPGGVQASGTFQTLPGIPVVASYTASNSEIAPSLGRNLSSGANGTVTIDLIEPRTIFEGRINQLDVRLSRPFRLGRAKLQAMFDVYNVLNASPILQINTTYGPAWLTPTAILDARLFKFGVQLDF